MISHQSWYARDVRGWTCDPPDDAAASFHRTLPGYAPTALVEAPALAAELGVGRLFVKDESARFDLGAFKFLGASWAGFRAVAGRTGYAGPAGLEGLRAYLTSGAAPTGGGALALVTATDGNHGRAVARTARLLGLPVRVYVPATVPGLVIDKIRAEGATVTVIDGNYDAAVAAARADATDWGANPGGANAGGSDHDGAVVLSVPVGVGSLAQAAVAHFRSRLARARSRVRLLGVEPDTAACVLRSLDAGALVSAATDATVMNGLNCGTPSSLAWPYLRDGLDAAVAVTDVEACEAITALAAAGVSAGPSGAAALAGARVALTGPGAATRRRDLGFADDGAGAQSAAKRAIVVCLSTEGPLSA